MAFLAALVPLISAAWPFLLGGTAAALGTVAVMTGTAAKLQEDLEAVQRALYLGRTRAWLQVRDDFSQLLASPLAQEALTAQGEDPFLLSQSLLAASNNEALKSFLLNPFPTMSSLQETDQYYALINELFQTNLMDRSVYLAAYSWYQAEYSRLTSGAAVPTTVPTLTEVLPLTTFPLGGGLTAGVRVRVGVVGATAPTIPAPTTAPAVALTAPIVTVIVPPIAVPPAQVVVQPIPAPQVTVNAPVDTAPIGLAMAGAIPLLGAQLLSGLAASAGPSAHAAQTARYSCMGGFLGPLLGLARSIGPQVAAGVILATDNPIRQALDRLVASIIEAELDPSRFVVPTSYEEAVANASTRLTQAVGFGLQAQAIAYTAEALTPLKQMGFSQMAGFMADLAGFQRIAAGLMGTVESAAIYKPLMYEANRRYRPNIPDDRQLTLMFQKRSLTRAELSSFQERLGLPDLYISRLPGFIFNDPNPALLIRAFQLAEPGAVIFSPDDQRIAEIAGIDLTQPDAYFRLKLAKGGLDDTDVQAFVPVLQMGILRREQTMRYDAINRLYRDGLIDEGRARQEIGLARAPAPITDYRLAAMTLQREHRILTDTRATIVMSMTRGLITREEAREQLGRLGLDGQRVELEVLKGTLGMVPGMRLEISRPEEALEELPVEGA